jgi:cytochrome c553
VPNTSGYTWTQLRDRFIAPIWHPSDHGPLPDIVANGRKPDVLACGFCHRADGPGGPENADLAGLPKHRTGEWSPLMTQVVSNLDQDDMLAIVAYLASLDP